jgi:hypothetical protein
MVSLRNQDQVVFLRPGEGILSEASLGIPDDHSIIYEQHNPDFISAEHGGPAVLVSDSENDRVIEYQRSNDSWVRTWHWTDDRMNWPRDADRLPNNHTLITDSQGERVIEVDATGDTTWQVNITTAYDAERLGTGDESSGGYSATTADISSHGSVSGHTNGRLPGVRQVINLVPARVRGALVFVAPPWFKLLDFIAAGIIIASIGLLLISEFYYSPYQVRSPIYRP